MPTYKKKGRENAYMRDYMRKRRARQKLERELLRRVIAPSQGETRIHVRMALELFYKVHQIASNPLLSDVEKVSQITHGVFQAPPYFWGIMREIANPVK